MNGICCVESCELRTYRSLRELSWFVNETQGKRRSGVALGYQLSPTAQARGQNVTEHSPTWREKCPNSRDK